MQSIIKAKEPFRFCTRLHLTELTGLSAASLGQLLSLIGEVPDACIYHHTHRFLQQYQYLAPEPPNDFAYWVDAALGERSLGEKLLNIDTIQYSSIRALRAKISRTIEAHLRGRPFAMFKSARKEEEFNFMKSVSFIISTDYLVYDLEGFKEVLKKISIDSVYFHVFEARLRLGRETNDFSNWIEGSLGEKALADELSGLNPYTYTLEELRNKMISLVERALAR